MPASVALGSTRTVGHAARSCGAKARLDWHVLFAPLINDAFHVKRMANAAAALVGAGRVMRDVTPVMVSAGFFLKLSRVPCAYIQMGIGNGPDLQSPVYSFDDAATSQGAPFFAGLVERSSKP